MTWRAARQYPAVRIVRRQLERREDAAKVRSQSAGVSPDFRVSLLDGPSVSQAPENRFDVMGHDPAMARSLRIETVSLRR
jgi:hypothetical protein